MELRLWRDTDFPLGNIGTAPSSRPPPASSELRNPGGWGDFAGGLGPWLKSASNLLSGVEISLRFWWLTLSVESGHRARRGWKTGRTTRGGVGIVRTSIRVCV